MEQQITLEDIQAQLEDLKKTILTSQKEVLTSDECAQYVGISKQHLYRLTHCSLIPFYKPNGRMIYFKRAELDNWLLRNRAKTAEELQMEAANFMIGRR